MVRGVQRLLQAAGMLHFLVLQGDALTFVSRLAIESASLLVHAVRAPVRYEGIGGMFASVSTIDGTFDRLR